MAEIGGYAERELAKELSMRLSFYERTLIYFTPLLSVGTFHCDF